MRNAKKYLALALASLMLVSSLTACGSSESTTEETTATEAGAAESSAPAETIAADDPELTALIEEEVPEKPGIENMGKIELASYKNLAVEVQEPVEITDEMVDSNIENILASNLVEVTDRASQDGDTVNIDYVGTKDGVEFDGGSAEGQDLTLGSGMFIPGFEEQLVGYKAGDEVEVKVTFPEDYAAEDLAGQDAVFAVTVNAVKTVPELTDEFVQGYSETATTVEEFRAELKQDLEAYNASLAKDSLRSSALEKLVAESTFEPSAEMIDYMEKSMIQSMVAEYQMYGMGLADMLNMYGMTVDAFKTEVNSMAQDNAKYEMALAKIAQEENISLTDAVLDDFAAEFSAMTGTEYTAESMKETFGEEMIAESAVQNAVLKVLEENAVVTYVPAETAAEASAE